MKHTRLIIFIVVALAQLGVPASVVWMRAQTLKQGRVWKFRTAPVDPVDAVRGRYIALRFAAETIPLLRESEALPSGTALYVTLTEDPHGFATVKNASETRVSGDNVVRGEIRGYSENKPLIHFPFDRLWVTEKAVPEAERAYLEHSRREKVDAYVTVRVRDGDAALEELYIDNQPLKEYLRAHSTR